MEYGGNPLKKQIQPERMNIALFELAFINVDVVFQNESEIHFMHKGSLIKYFPYTGWATGKTINDGRGLQTLLNQIK